MDNKDVKWVLLSTTVLWIVVSITVCYAISRTGHLWSMLLFILLPTPSLKSKDKKDVHKDEY